MPDPGQKSHYHSFDETPIIVERPSVSQPAQTEGNSSLPEETNPYYPKNLPEQDIPRSGTWEFDPALIIVPQIPPPPFSDHSQTFRGSRDNPATEEKSHGQKPSVDTPAADQRVTMVIPASVAPAQDNNASSQDDIDYMQPFNSMIPYNSPAVPLKPKKRKKKKQPAPKISLPPVIGQSEENVLNEEDEKILTSLKQGLFQLEQELHDKGANMDKRKQNVLNGLTKFIPEFEDKLQQIRRGEETEDEKFKITYEALKIYADPDNDKLFGNNAPFFDLKSDGTRNYDMSKKKTQCNHFTFIVIENATNKKLTKGEDFDMTTTYGIMGAGVYFGNDRNLSRSSQESLSAPSLLGEMGDIVAFSQIDPWHSNNNHTGSDHVGIYLGYGIYVNASGAASHGVYAYPHTADSVIISDVAYHAHFVEVK